MGTSSMSIMQLTMCVCLLIIKATDAAPRAPIPPIPGCCGYMYGRCIYFCEGETGNRRSRGNDTPHCCGYDTYGRCIAVCGREIEKRNRGIYPPPSCVWLNGQKVCY